MRNLIVALPVLLFAGFLAAQAPDLAKLDIVERSVPDGPVALVDGTAIDGSDFVREYRRHLHNVMNMVQDPDLNDQFRVRAGLTILGDMIRSEILLKEAQRRKITVSDADVQAEYKKKMDFFSKRLEQEINAVPTEEQVLQKAGQTREEALASIRNQRLVEKISDTIAEEKGSSVSTEDARTYYEKNPNLFQTPGGLHLNQMLAIPKPNPAKAEKAAWQKAEEQMTRARARVLAGEQFAAVARDMSEAPDASKGGDMGMIPAAGLPPFFVERASKMKPGDISDVFRSEYGVHVIQLVATEASDIVSFEDAQEKIKQVLKNVKIEEAVLQFCEPVVNDGNRTKIFIQLERSLAVLDEKKEKKDS